MKQQRQKLSIGPLSGISVRTRVRLATITELVKGGEVIGTGVATIHPGEEETMDFKTGAKLSGDRAIEDFLAQGKLIAQDRKLRAASPQDFMAYRLVEEAIKEDERRAKRSLTSLLN